MQPHRAADDRQGDDGDADAAHDVATVRHAATVLPSELAGAVGRGDATGDHLGRLEPGRRDHLGGLEPGLGQRLGQVDLRNDLGRLLGEGLRRRASVALGSSGSPGTPVGAGSSSGGNGAGGLTCTRHHPTAAPPKARPTTAAVADRWDSRQ